MTEQDGYEEALRLIEQEKGEQRRSLHLSSLQLQSIPMEVFELEYLDSLYLDGNNLESIPSEITQLRNLEFLHLHDNELYELPETFDQLEKLRSLDLSENYFNQFPKNILSITTLNKLFLTGNHLHSVPPEINRLHLLETLHLDFCEIEELPYELGELNFLFSLDLQGNYIEVIPENFLSLINLYYLNLKNNAIKVGPEVYNLPPQEQIREILKWQESQQAGTLRPIHEAKVLFVGESNFGKTHLIEHLKKGKIEREIKTTHGIERSKLPVKKDDKEIQLNIWDLGGQEFMRSTHQFFFSERTLYVLVTLARRERNELNHWLKLANHLGDEAPVIVVINQIDKDPHDVDRTSLERDYPNIVGFVRTSINNCEDGKAKDLLDQLKQKIITTVADPELMPSVFEERSPEWFAVKEQLEKLEDEGKNFITYSEYEQLDFIKDLSEVDQKSNLKLLSMIGAVVSFVDDPRLIDTNVINPQWIMDGVYAIINDPVVKDEKKGKLHINDLGRILDKEQFPKGRHAFLLELMRKFNLCYPAKDQRDIYFIPDLFEDVEPGEEWDSESAMRFRFNYDDFSPDAFITRFIVELHQDIVDDKRWRSGVYISNGSCEAKVYQSYRKNYIHVEVIGDQGEGRSYLYTIREAFRRLHDNYEKLEIKQEVLYKKKWFNYERLVKLEAKIKPWYDEELDEDLPINEILNSYSTPNDRQGKQKKIKIFLASSSELQKEREQFEIFINRENKELYDKGVFLHLEQWEDFLDNMDQNRLQDTYNIAVKKCDLFVSLFFTKVGPYTTEEFENAFQEFKETGKPLIYTYFKNADIKTGEITDEIQTLLDFKKKLKELGHFKTEFKDSNDLHLQFKKQLEKILPKF